MEDAENVVIVGAGISGLATALGLHRMGLRCLVLESADRLRSTGYTLATWSNAWRALDALGIGDGLREKHVLLQRLVLGSLVTGMTTFQIAVDEQGKFGQHELRRLGRNNLLEALAKELPHGTIRFRAKLVSIEEVGNLKLLHFEDGSALTAKVLVGCDGVNSVVAKWLGLKTPAYSGRSAARGIAVFPEGHRLKPEFMQYFGNGFRFGCLPFDDMHVYWYFTWSPSPKDGDVEESPAKLKKFVLSNICKAPPELVEVVEQSDVNGVLASKLRYRTPLELMRAELHRGNTCVAGDALHAMTPEAGQGGCVALEDGVVLARCLGAALLAKPSGGACGGVEEERERIEQGLKKYVRERRWRCVEVVTTSYIVGMIQLSNGLAMKFVSDKLLASVMARKMLSISNFDCGQLRCGPIVE